MATSGTNDTVDHKLRIPWWVKLPIILAAFALGAAGTLHFLGSSATAKWERYADKLRDGGMPLTYEEIDQQRTTYADDENSANLILELGPLLDEAPQETIDLEILVFDWMREGQDVLSGIAGPGIEQSRALIADYRELFDKLERIRAMPGGRFAWQGFENPLNGIGHGVGYVLELRKLLHVRLLVVLVDRDTEAATDTLHLLAKVAESLDEVPDSLSRHVQARVQTTLASDIEQTLRAGVLAESDLQSLSVMLNDRQAATTMKWALLGDRAFAMTLFDVLADGGATWMPDYSGRASIFAPVAPNFLPVWQVRRGQMLAADLMTKVVEVGGDPLALLEAAREYERQADIAPPTALVSYFPLSPTCELHQADLAQLRCAALGVAAERFRLESERFPASLDELVPAYLEALPADPFNGEPMRLAATEQGIVIYSVYENLSDDGGDIAQSEARPDPLDVGFRLVEPEHRGIVLIDLPSPDED